MAIFHAERVQSTYCIEVGVDVLLSIVDRDWREEDCTLLDRLERLDCHRIEYEGIFGPFVWVTIDKEYDTAVNMLHIMQLIDDYARGKELPDDCEIS